ncbi:MAG: CDP-alcohol phosphatidyltransferase family protein [Candidatus Rokuibacteriota bacterium]
MSGPDRDGHRGVRGLLYLSVSEDLAAGCASLAGKPVAYRALMTALRAGCTSVAVPPVFRGTAVERAIAAHPRSRAAAGWLSGRDVLAGAEPLLLIPVTSILPATSLRGLLQTRPVTVLSPSPREAPVALVDRSVCQRLAERLASGAPVGPALRGALDAVPRRVAPGSWSVRATSESARRDAERMLLSDLGSAIDSRLDTVVHRRLSRVLTRGLVALGVTPNTISLLSVAIGLVAAWCWALATVGGAVAGLAFYLLSVVLDHSDGEVARLTFAESRLGAWLDTLGDTLVHASGAVALGLAAQRLDGIGLLYGALAALGFTVSALVSKTLPRPKAEHGLARTVSALGTRDGFYVLLLLYLLTLGLAPAALPHLVLFAAIGSHLYWLSVLATRSRAAPTAVRTAPLEASARGGSPQAAER